MGIFRQIVERITPWEETPGAEGFGAPLHIAFERRELPGSGARQYAFETLALPMYTPIGWGVANKDSFDPNGSPIVGWDQTIGIDSLIYNGDYTGQIVSQPLLNTDSTDNSDLVVAAFGQSYVLPDNTYVR